MSLNMNMKISKLMSSTKKSSYLGASFGRSSPLKSQCAESELEGAEKTRRQQEILKRRKKMLDDRNTALTHGIAIGKLQETRAKLQQIETPGDSADLREELGIGR